MDYYVYAWWCYLNNDWTWEGVFANSRAEADEKSMALDWEGGAPPEFSHVVRRSNG